MTAPAPGDLVKVTVEATVEEWTDDGDFRILTYGPTRLVLELPGEGDEREGKIAVEVLQRGPA